MSEDRTNSTANRLKLTVTILFWMLAVFLLMAAGSAALAFQDDNVPDDVGTEDRISFHPQFALLDANGENVLDSGGPISTMETCGSCHDAAFIEEHSGHAQVGLSSLTEAGTVETGREWDTGPGYYGRWDPILYRYLSASEDDRQDLTLAEWIQVYGTRHAGGGPAVETAGGQSLLDLDPDTNDPYASIVDPETGELVPWDWVESGVVEMNCFLCHMESPNNEARIAALEAGQFGWANTATLVDSGLVNQAGDGYIFEESSFDENGLLLPEFVTVQDPTIENCGQCHGEVHTEAQIPLTLNQCDDTGYVTATTGQIVSPQKISVSGMNIQDKENLSRSFDVHAERALECVDCHYSLNNPIYYQGSDESQPDHLIFDPRRIDLGEYLYRPVHQFAGVRIEGSAISPVAADLPQSCDSCHSMEAAHPWLPYVEAHAAALTCESCHVPEVYGPAYQSVDWTVITPEVEAVSVCRGSSGDLITGYQPVLLPSDGPQGEDTLAPYNLISYWYWVYGDPARPLPLRELKAAYLDGDGYHPEVVAVFDVDNDGTLSESELVIDTDEKETLIINRLEALGVDNPRISGDVQPYAIHHSVTNSEFVTRDCADCHNEDSRLTQPIAVSNTIPGGVMPELHTTGDAQFGGELSVGEDGILYYTPDTQTSVGRYYIFGHDRVRLVDWAGIGIFLATMLGVSAHGGLRYFAARRRAANHAGHDTHRVYMYSVYERFWHWLQTAAIMLLLFTGIVIHRPDMFGLFGFRSVVLVHNVLAAILVVNAALSLFYHVVGGEIRQFIPRPYGFFDNAIEQAKFYVGGIFRGEEHPFEKTPQHKLNPLQSITYFGILNVLLPLQIITGALMWGAQRWPQAAEAVGGLNILAPIHTMVAWLFASFIVMHVYLTTTGNRPLDGIKAMMFGWEEN